MIRSVAQVAVPVGDYDGALAWYTRVLGLEVRRDEAIGPGYRSIAVGARGQDVELVLHLSEGSRRRGGEHGRSPLLVFHTDNCLAEYKRLELRGVDFLRGPEALPWGTQAMFQDPYGNTYVLVERRAEQARAGVA